MDKFTKIMFLVWCGLAIASFVSSFWAPLIIKIIGLTFGSVNLLLMGTWVSSIIAGRRELRKQRKLLAEQEKKED